MTKAILALAPLALLAAGAALNSFAGKKALAGDDSRSNGRVPVVVELFTSEGCSSCPPADAFLAQLEERQPIAGAEVIGLEEHVDYWDRQGWVDPFSGFQWTERQEEYAAAQHDGGVYTPQMVVNGRSDFVGSRESEARKAIVQAAAQPGTQVTIKKLESNKGDEAQFETRAGKLTGLTRGDHQEVWLAITETGLHSDVKAGENSGVDVHHGAVVRSLRKLGNAEADKDPSFSGDSVVKLDKKWNRRNLRAVVFVQEKRSRHILGAAESRLER
jgi:hypothetical protein